MADIPRDIVDLLPHWMADRPNAEAMRYGDRIWSWSELSDRVRRNAAAQLASGLRAGDRVAFFDKNHPACLETTLACALIGTANAVVNFRLAAGEIGYVLADAQAAVVFVGAEFLPVFDQIRDQLPALRQVIVIGTGPDGGVDDETDEYESWLAAAEPLDGPADYQQDDCFLQLYTSGTTGFPKGAMLTHRAMTAHSVAVAQTSGVDADSVAMVAMPLFHVGGSSWALLALFHGARIVLVRELLPGPVLDELVRERVTHTFFVPAVFAFLLQVPDVAERDYSALRGLVYGASPMPLPLLRRSLEVFPGDFYQVYGMTEACGVVTELGPADHRDPGVAHRMVSAGKPISGVELRVADPATGEPMPAGEVGEVVLRTEQAMAGYWRQPEASERALDADGWLHSGDAGYLDADGYLYISDRIKDMIISGGENIYPAEVERVLAEHPGVADVAVIGVPDDTWGEVPAAMVVAAPGAVIDRDELIDYCRQRLAGFKCPKSVQVLTELPRNATGKVLKRALREPLWADRDRAV